MAVDEAAATLSPVPGGVCAARGFEAAGARGGLKTQGPDIALLLVHRAGGIGKRCWRVHHQRRARPLRGSE
jgi:hypothetical protein